MPAVLTMFCCIPKFSCLVFSDTSKQPTSGMMWRATSGVFNTATSALSIGVGGVRWVAGKTYDVGAVVASKLPVPSLPIGKKKDKNE